MDTNFDRASDEFKNAADPEATWSSKIGGARDKALDFMKTAPASIKAKFKNARFDNQADFDSLKAAMQKFKDGTAAEIGARVMGAATGLGSAIKDKAGKITGFGATQSDGTKSSFIMPKNVDVRPLQAYLASKLPSDKVSNARGLALAYLSSASRMTVADEASPSVQLGVKQAAQVLDDNALRMITQTTGNPSFENAVKLSRYLPSAYNDATKPGSMLQSMLPQGTPESRARQIGWIVDSNAPNFNALEAQNPFLADKAVKRTAPYFNGDEGTAREALRYYSEHATEAMQLANQARINQGVAINGRTRSYRDPQASTELGAEEPESPTDDEALTNAQEADPENIKAFEKMSEARPGVTLIGRVPMDAYNSPYTRSQLPALRRDINAIRAQNPGTDVAHVNGARFIRSLQDRGDADETASERYGAWTRSEGERIRRLSERDTQRNPQIVAEQQELANSPDLEEDLRDVAKKKAERLSKLKLEDHPGLESRIKDFDRIKAEHDAAYTKNLGRGMTPHDAEEAASMQALSRLHYIAMPRNESEPTQERLDQYREWLRKETPETRKRNEMSTLQVEFTRPGAKKNFVRNFSAPSMVMHAPKDADMSFMSPTEKARASYASALADIYNARGFVRVVKEPEWVVPPGAFKSMPRGLSNADAMNAAPRASSKPFDESKIRIDWRSGMAIEPEASARANDKVPATMASNYARERSAAETRAMNRWFSTVNEHAEALSEKLKSVTENKEAAPKPKIEKPVDLGNGIVVTPDDITSALSKRTAKGPMPDVRNSVMTELANARRNGEQPGVDSMTLSDSAVDDALPIGALNLTGKPVFVADPTFQEGVGSYAGAPVGGAGRVVTPVDELVQGLNNLALTRQALSPTASREEYAEAEADTDEKRYFYRMAKQKWAASKLRGLMRDIIAEESGMDQYVPPTSLVERMMGATTEDERYAAANELNDHLDNWLESRSQNALSDLASEEGKYELPGNTEAKQKSLESQLDAVEYMIRSAATAVRGFASVKPMKNENLRYWAGWDGKNSYTTSNYDVANSNDGIVTRKARYEFKALPPYLKSLQYRRNDLINQLDRLGKGNRWERDQDSGIYDQAANAVAQKLARYSDAARESINNSWAHTRKLRAYLFNAPTGERNPLLNDLVGWKNIAAETHPAKNESADGFKARKAQAVSEIALGNNLINALESRIRQDDFRASTDEAKERELTRLAISYGPSALASAVYGATQRNYELESAGRFPGLKQPDGNRLPDTRYSAYRQQELKSLAQSAARRAADDAYAANALLRYNIQLPAPKAGESIEDWYKRLNHEQQRQIRTYGAAPKTRSEWVPAKSKYTAVDGTRATVTNQVLTNGERRAFLANFRTMLLRAPDEARLYVPDLKNGYAPYSTMAEFMSALGKTKIKYNDEKINETVAKVSKAEMDKVLEQIRLMRGPEVEAAFNKMTDRSGFFKTEDRDGKQARLIRISIYASNPMSVGYHEALHDFFSMLGGDAASREMRKVIVDAASAPHIKARLKTLLKDQPAALEQLKDEEERAAYLFQFWGSGDISLGEKPTNIFVRIRNWFRDMLNITSTDTRAQALFSMLSTGQLQSPSMYAQAIAALHENDGLSDKFITGVNQVLGPIHSKLMDTPAQRLRAYWDENTSWLADKLGVDSDDGKMGFIQKRFQREGQWENRLAKILNGTTATQRQEAMRNLQSMKAPSSDLERGIADYLEGLWNMMHAAGVKTKKNGKWVEPEKITSGYFPRMFDGGKIAANREAFINLLMREGKMKRADAVNLASAIELGDGQIDLNDTEWDPSYSPAMMNLNSRQLLFITKNNAQKFVQFQTSDLTNCLALYMRKAVHRAVFAQIFGNDGAEITKRLTAARISDSERRDAANCVKAMTGSLGTQGMSRSMKNILGAVTTLENFVCLPMAVFSQFNDPVMLGARSGQWADSVKGFTNAIKALARQTRPEDGYELARELGIVSQDSVLEAMGMSYGAMNFPKGLRAANHLFFKWNGMQGWTNAMRAAATLAGQRYLIQHATNTTGQRINGMDSDKALEELGVSAQDVMNATKGGQLSLNAASGDSPEVLASKERVAEAMWQFVDQAVMRPNAATRPAWMSDPRFVIFGYLRQFSFTMQHVILNRAAQQMEHSENCKPMLMLMAMAPTVLLTDIARSIFLGMPHSFQTAQYGSYLWHCVVRSGVTGTGDIYGDIMSGLFSGQPGSTAGILGPAVQTLALVGERLMGNPAVSTSDVLRRVIPGSQLLGT
jgi:hypothetical protein